MFAGEYLLVNTYLRADGGNPDMALPQM